MAMDVRESDNLVAVIRKRIIRRRMRKITIWVLAFAAFGLLLSAILLLPVALSRNSSGQSLGNTGAVGSHDNNALQPAQIQGLISDYPLTWEESIGDLGAISKPAGVGDTLGGLTAVGLKAPREPVQQRGCST